MDTRRFGWSAVIFSMLIFTCSAWAHANYIGYSGAPGAGGTCAGSCHGSSGGTVVISGFPQEYVPGQQYTITIRKLSGNSIRNFNASCRIGTGSQNAGVLAAGTGTSTYNTTDETNGIHLSSNNQDSATFLWTAPSAGTGSVRLYVTSLQGGYSGLNTVITATAQESVPSAVGGTPQMLPAEMSLGPAYPNPFNATVTIPFALTQPEVVTMTLFDITGREVTTLASGRFDAGLHELQWSAEGIGSGIYLVRLQNGTQTLTTKIVALK